jgi:hypothetical protein
MKDLSHHPNHPSAALQAFEALMPVFRRISGVKPISLQGEQRRLAQRFQNRLELKMILMDSSALRMIGPGQYKSMGTGGLKNEEVIESHSGNGCHES